jgi:CheY-like chemotaxis protein
VKRPKGALGVWAVLTKPAALAELRRVLAEAEAPSAPAAVCEASPEHEPARPLRILVAEDNSVNQVIARRLLERRGHQVAIAGDGGQALAAIEGACFDLVMMDVQMPVIDGLEATRRIRARERGTGTHLPVIAMTAHAMKEDRDRCRDAGMDGYVTKPVEASELFAAIAAAVT